MLQLSRHCQIADRQGMWLEAVVSFSVDSPRQETTACQVSLPELELVPRLLTKACIAVTDGGSNDGIAEQCQAAVRKHLHDGAYSQQEIEEALGQSLDKFFHESASSQRRAHPC